MSFSGKNQSISGKGTWPSPQSGYPTAPQAKCKIDHNYDFNLRRKHILPNF